MACIAWVTQKLAVDHVYVSGVREKTNLATELMPPPSSALLGLILPCTAHPLACFAHGWVIETRSRTSPRGEGSVHPALPPRSSWQYVVSTKKTPQNSCEQPHSNTQQRPWMPRATLTDDREMQKRKRVMGRSAEGGQETREWRESALTK